MRDHVVRARAEGGEEGEEEEEEDEDEDLPALHKAATDGDVAEVNKLIAGGGKGAPLVLAQTDIGGHACVCADAAASDCWTALQRGRGYCVALACATLLRLRQLWGGRKVA